MSSTSENWLALLGVKGGPAINPHGAMPTSSLLRMAGKTIVVDCGTGVALGIARQGIALKTIDAVFITHLHSDHYLDLGPLLHSAWTAGLARPIPVYGPKGLDAYWHHFIESMRFDIETRMADEGRPDLKSLVNLHVLDDGNVGTYDRIEVSALRNLHPPLIDSFALRFDGVGCSVVFSGDTAFFPPLAAFAKGATVLVHEAMYLEGIDRLVARIGNGDDRLRKHMFASHTPVEDAGRVAEMAEVDCLAIHHMVPIDDPLLTAADWEAGARKTWAGTLHIGRDGLRIPVVPAG
jgi:ribonuclease BN (tRNA processing enzyme)